MKRDSPAAESAVTSFQGITHTDRIPTSTVACDHFILKDSIRTYAGGTILFSTLVVTCANAINNSVITVRNLLPIVVENTTTGSEFPVAAVTRSPMSPMNSVTGRIAIV